MDRVSAVIIESAPSVSGHGLTSFDEGNGGFEGGVVGHWSQERMLLWGVAPLDSFKVIVFVVNSSALPWWASGQVLVKLW